MPTTLFITGAGSGFGLAAAKTLARDGHIVYGGYYPAHQPSEADLEKDTPIRWVPCDITKQDSVNAAVERITSEVEHIDCLIHNAGHMNWGVAEAYSAEQFQQYFDINTVGAHRLNLAILPLMRKAGRGHIIWISSSSARGGSGPLLAPYFAAKAAMHSLANSLSTEIACWGIETTIIVPGIFAGTNHFTNAGKPGFPDVAAEYMEGPFKGVDTIMTEGMQKIVPSEATPQLVADAIADAVKAPRGRKPFRITVDPVQDGADEIMTLADQKHEEFLKRVGIHELCTFQK